MLHLQLAIPVQPRPLHGSSILQHNAALMCMHQQRARQLSALQAVRAAAVAADGSDAETEAKMVERCLLRLPLLFGGPVHSESAAERGLECKGPYRQPQGDSGGTAEVAGQAAAAPPVCGSTRAHAADGGEQVAL